MNNNIRIKRTAYCNYKEYYSFDLTEEIVKEWSDIFQNLYNTDDTIDFEVVRHFLLYPQDTKNTVLEKRYGHSTLQDIINDFINEEIWNNYVDNERDEVYDTEETISFLGMSAEETNTLLADVTGPLTTSEIYDRAYKLATKIRDGNWEEVSERANRYVEFLAYENSIRK